MINKQQEHKKAGRLEIVCGPMFSGKTEELIRRLRRASIAKQNVIAFKHTIDQRFSFECIASHNGNKIDAQVIEKPEQMIDYAKKAPIDVVGIDEVQFFDTSVIFVIEELINMGKRVIAAGLDLDFRALPFGPMPTLLAIADDITKLKAICCVCSKDAPFTQRLIDGNPARCSDPIILVGAQECYQARCRSCYKIDQLPLTYHKKLFEQEK